jgi:hypothetical protein
MRRSIAAALTALAGLVVLVDLAIANPALGGLAGWLNQLLVLLAAGAAVAGALMLVVRHIGRLARQEDQLGSIAVLAGIGLVLLPGLAPGSTGADAPAVRWVVAAFLAPLVAAVLALLFPLLLVAASRGLRIRGRETAVMLASAAAVLILLLPVGGQLGAWLASTATWVRDVPIAAVFRGLLIGVAATGALTAARILLGSDASHD